MGCWGVDIDLTLADLLQVLVAIPGQFSINLRFIEPLWLLRNLEKLLPIFQSGKIHSFCVPIQSASQSVLTAMNRNYRISDVVAACNHIMQDTKVSSISSIIMVGFPGETTQDFAKSYSLLERCDIPLYQVLKYEGRPDTPSEQMPDKVSDEIKELRQQRFMKKMKLMKFVGLSAKLAEKIVTKKFGPLK
jgi:threonylcarbamoyladenosine tRNA methylthiotransferase CDKAL1